MLALYGSVYFEGGDIMSIVQKILGRFGYYRLEPGKFYTTDAKGVPHATLQKLGDSYYGGIVTGEMLDKRMDEITKEPLP